MREGRARSPAHGPFLHTPARGLQSTHRATVLTLVQCGVAPSAHPSCRGSFRENAAGRRPRALLSPTGKGQTLVRPGHRGLTQSCSGSWGRPCWVLQVPPTTHTPGSLAAESLRPGGQSVRTQLCSAPSFTCWMKRFRSSSGVRPCWARTMQVGRCRLSM